MRSKRIAMVLLSALFLFGGCSGAPGGGQGNSGGDKENQDDIGMTIQEALANKDFVGPDNVSAVDKNIFVGIKSNTKVFDAEEQIEYYVMVYTPLEEEMTIQISTVNSFLNTEETSSHLLKTGMEQQTIAGKIKGSGLGINHFNVKIKDSSGEVIMDQSKDIAVMNVADAPSDDTFLWGVQPFVIRSIEYNESLNGAHCFTGLTPEETYDRVFEYVDKTGANLIRDGMVWTSNQPSQVVDNYSLMTRFSEDAKAKGYLIDWHLGGTPDWAVEDRFQNADVKWNKPPRLDAWADYVEKVAELFAGEEHIIFEIINECNWPDFFYGTAAEYTAILDKSVEILKGANAESTVINGGMVMPQANNFVTEESENFRFEEDPVYYAKYAELINAGKMPYVAYHSHANFRTFIEKDAVNMMYYLQDAGIDQTKLFLNESGMFNADGMAQADDVMKKALWTKCNDHQGFVLFNFRDIEGGVLSPPGWGIITQDGQPKASYVAYTNAIEKLSGYTNKHTYANTLYNAYLMENGKNDILVLFKDKSVPELNVTLPDGAGCTAYDMFGNIIEDGYAKLGDYPVYIVFDGKVDAEEIQVPISAIYKKLLSEYDRIDNFPEE